MGKIYKSLVFGGDIALAVLDTTDIVNQAIRYHKLSPLAAAGLGRALTATAFMATSLKNKEHRLSVTIDGDGVGGHIITSADGNLFVRGRIDNPSAELPPNKNGKLDVGGLVGKGFMTVVKSMGLKEPYVGKCRLVSGEIAEDFTAYYAYSEQQPTAMALGVYIDKSGKCIGAGGIVFQPMPNAKEENIDKCETLLGEFGDISKQISEIGGEGVCRKFFPEYEFTEFSTEYKCNCSKDYIDKVLLTIGKKELCETIESEGKVEVLCEFCDKKYVYTKKDIDELFEQ